MSKMEGNKDESDKCLKIALKHLNNGDKDSALKFILKAEKLFPSPRAKELLRKHYNENSGGEANGNFEDQMGEDTASASSAQNGPTTDSGGASSAKSRHRHSKPSAAHQAAAGAAEDGGSTNVQKHYTPEQMQLVQKVRKCKDYYEILGLTKESFNEEDLKKAYRKMALKLHPDKNHAPGATEAFKAVGNAFAILSEPSKRQRYDQFGTEEEQQIRHSRHSRAYDYTRGFEADVTAEELFNMFFGGGLRGDIRPRRPFANGTHQHHHQANQDQSESDFTYLLRLSPIIIMVLLSLLSSFLTADPSFSLQRTQKYTVEKRTQHLQVPYYVKSTFNSEFKGNVRRLEQEVEEDYVNSLRSSCFQERQYRDSLLWRARYYGDRNLQDRANELKTPNCDKLEKIYGG